MSKVEVNQVTQQCGTTLTVGGGACKTAVVDATTVTLGRCGGTVSLASGATQSGFGRTGTVDWDTASIKTTTFTAVNGNGYFCNTSGGAFTVNLPAGVAGNIVAVADYTRTFNTYNLTIAADGSEKIGGVNANDAELTVNGQSATFVYVDAAEGWVNINETQTSVTGVPPFVRATGGCVTCSGNFKMHTFLGPGTFCVTGAGTPAGSTKVDYLVVAGGGGGAVQQSAGGGGGGFRSSFPSPGCNAGTVTVAETGYPITVGGGGAATPLAPSVGVTATPGVDSTFDSITSAGGGGGGGYPSITGAAGGSGGGGAANAGAAGAGNTPAQSSPAAPVQGYAGGAGVTYASGGGGGGGGAAAVGGAGPGAAPGGAGAQNNIDFNNYYWSGGGGGGAHAGAPGGNGGIGGGGGGGAQSSGGSHSGGTGGGSAINCGGAGATYPPAATGGDGGDNSGGGGGGSGCLVAAGNGGSGVVIIRYKFQ